MDELDEHKASLDELMKFARGGMARQMRERNGRPLDPEEGAEPMAAEPIPGVEPDEEESLEPGMGPDGAGIDPETLRAILETLKAGQ